MKRRHGPETELDEETIPGPSSDAGQEPTDRMGPDETSTPQPDGAVEDDSTTLPPDGLTVSAGAGAKAPVDLGRGTTVHYFGDYEILKELGRGGMGVVYKARQLSLNRAVALKVVKAGVLADDEERRRFQNEAEAVALLDHVGIVPVHEVGEHEGKPYLSMKLIEGGNLTASLARYKQDPRAAAALTAEIAEAVHHAHMRGILHRDLKPANILLDAGGHPHVTDFGLAKRVEEDLELTASGAILGTPSYMSPEQASGRRGAITTASDVYGLGAILYALLSGKAPFGGGSVVETIDAVRNQPPVPPRRANPDVPRDLETICLKCLEKDARRRYSSASALADDLKAWLESRPISARPVGAFEKLRLWCRRNPAVAASAAAVVMALVLGTGSVIAVQTRANGLLEKKNLDLQASNAELDKQRLRAVSAEAEERRRAAEVQETADFQSKMLAQVDPAQAGLNLSQDVRARFVEALAKAETSDVERARQEEAFVNAWSRVNSTDAARTLIDGAILKPAAEAIDVQFKDRPLIAATLRQTLGERYEDLGDYEAAALQMKAAIDARRRTLGDDHPETLEAMVELGRILTSQDKYDESSRLLKQAMDTGRKVLGDDHRTTLSATHGMGVVLSKQGRWDEAASLLSEAYERRLRLFGEDDRDTLTAIASMGDILKAQSKLNESLPYLRRAVDGRRKVLGPDADATLNSLNNLGTLYVDLKRHAEAVACFREVCDKRRVLLGAVHPRTMNALRNLAGALSREGNDAEAESLMREALADDRRILGDDHLSTLVSLNNLGAFLLEKNRPDDAEPFCRESLEKNRRILGPNHPRTLVATNVMGYVYSRKKRPADAEPLLREAIEISRRINGENHQDTLVFIQNLGTSIMDQKKPAEAEPAFRTVAEKASAALGDRHPLVVGARTNLARVLLDQKKFAEAVEVLASSEKTARAIGGREGDRSLAMTLQRLGTARIGLHEFERAEATLLEAHGVVLRMRAAGVADSRNCERTLVQLYTDWDAAKPGNGYDAKAAEWKKKLEEPASPSPTPKAS
ncbi:serine/threonine-protein kinase [Paludisphaera rhizosphaerae]|uniref:serine/threonine-protein kinase n=1 Tax=Paludisphaera rhizosphaerae TaxID=2711216 RepID=UPI0013EB68A6|nr:serine/threonine-protein kinase [Paludisphaera rhizosphaerae]